MVLARRGEAEIEIALKNTTRGTAHYMPKSEHESMPLNEVALHRATKEKANGVKAVVVHNEILPWCDGEEEGP